MASLYIRTIAPLALVLLAGCHQEPIYLPKTFIQYTRGHWVTCKINAWEDSRGRKHPASEAVPAHEPATFLLDYDQCTVDGKPWHP